MPQKISSSLKNWKIINVEDIALRINYGFTASSTKKNTGVKFLRITDIQEYNVDWANVPYCEIDADVIPKYLLSEGDIVFARTGATVGKSFLIKEDKLPHAVFASYLIRIQLSKLISPKYVFYFFQSPDYWKQIGVRSIGVGQPSVNGSSLSKLTLPICSISEQNNLVNKIEELFSELDFAKSCLLKSQKLLKAYRQTVLRKAFNGSISSRWRSENKPINRTMLRNKISKLVEEDIESLLTENKSLPPEWLTVQLQLLTTKITDGTHFTPDYTKEGIPFISVKDIYHGKVHFTNTKYISNEDHEILIKRCKPEKGDILMTKSGAIGRLAIVSDTREFSLFVSVALIKQKRELIHGQYLLYALENYINSIDISQDIKGAVLKNFHLEDIRITSIPYCSLEEQKAIISELESAFTLIVNLDNSIDKGLGMVDKLRHSILNNAFNRKLSTYLDDEESIDTFLAKIQLEKIEFLNNNKIRERKKTKPIKIMESKSALQILTDLKSPIPAKDLWQQSMHKHDIEAFYDELKGIYHLIKETKSDTESLISLNNEDR
jgi:type I restriction enzyme S subunit